MNNYCTLVLIGLVCKLLKKHTYLISVISPIVFGSLANSDQFQRYTKNRGYFEELKKTKKGSGIQE